MIGQLLAPSVFPEEDPSVADQYFTDEPINTQHVKVASSALQPSLEILRTQLHQVSMHLKRSSIYQILSLINTVEAFRQNCQISI